MEELKRLCESFTHMSEIPTAIVDLKGNVIIATGWQPICTQFHRINDQTKKLCIESDTVLASQLRQGEKYIVYSCKNGLVDIAVPIIVGEIHVGNFFTGQFFTEKPDIDFFRKQAHTHNFNESDYLSALEKTPIFDDQQVKRTIAFLAQLTETIGNIGLKNLQSKEQARQLEMEKSFLKEIHDEHSALIEKYKIQNEKLAESNQFNIQIIQSAQEGILVHDKDLRYQVLNPFMERFIGLSESQVIGKHPAELFPFLEKEGVIENLKKALNGETITSDDFPFYIPESQVNGWASETTAPLRNAKGEIIGVIGVVRDITKRKQIEESLRETNEYLENLFNYANAPIVVWDTNLEITHFNPAFERLSGYLASEVKSKKIDLLFPADKIDYSLNLIKKTSVGEQWETVEIEILRKDSNIRTVLWNSANVLDNKGERIIATIAQGQDITERKHAEEEIKSLLTEKEVILREVHHRIKNNMSNIKALLSLQAGSLHDQNAILALNEAGNRVQSMMLLYDKLYRSVDFQNIFIGNYLPYLVDEILVNFPYHKNVKIEKKIDNFILDAKRLQILGIIINELLTNIMKYAFEDREEGVILIEVYLESIVTNADNTVNVVIQDNGRTMPETIDFEHSTGFGLSLINLLTKQIKGSIVIERENGTKIKLKFKK